MSLAFALLATMLVPEAHAGHLSVAGGLAAGGGTNSAGDWSTVGPAATLSYTGRLLILEWMAGASSYGLLAPHGTGTVLAAPLQLDLGAGIGVRAVSVGVFSSFGYSGPGGGLYAQVTAPGAGWTRRVGLEGRVFSYGRLDTAGAALLLRVEPDLRARETRKAEEEAKRAERRPPPPSYPPEAAPVVTPTEPPPAEPAPEAPAEDAVHPPDPYDA